MPNLNLNRIIKVDISYSQSGMVAGNFGTLLILGANTQAINPVDRLRYFTDADSAVQAFGLNAPETKAVQAFFSQVPSPRACYVGRWNQGGSDALLGNTLPTAASDPLWTQLKAITNASFAVAVDKTVYQVKPFSLASVTGVANLQTTLTAALAASTPPVPVTVYGDATKGELFMRPSNVGSNISYLSAPAAGTDISTLLRLAASSPSVWLSYFGTAESLVDAVQACRTMAGDWFGLMIVGTPAPTEAAMIAVADLVETWKSTTPALYFMQTDSAKLLDGGVTDDLASTVQTRKFDNTIVTYAKNDPSLVGRVAGKEFSVDYSASNSVIDVCYKQLSGAIPDVLMQGQDSILERKNANFFAQWGSQQTLTFYRNGRMGSGKYLDEIHGLAWLRAAIQAAIFNVFTSSPTKIPQTKSGQARINTAIEQVCAQAVRAGFAAPGVWNQQGFGSIKQGDTLASGYYVFADSLELQSDADRQARLLPPVHVALCGAGSAQNIAVNVVFQP